MILDIKHREPVEAAQFVLNNSFPFTASAPPAAGAASAFIAGASAAGAAGVAGAGGAVCANVDKEIVSNTANPNE